MPELLPIAGATPLPGEARDLAPGLRWLRFPLPFPPGHVNVWLLEEEAGWLAVDSGVESRETRAHWSTALAGAAFGGRPLTNLLVTHFHPDHVGLAGWLAERHGMLPMMTRVEWLMTRALWFDIGPEMTEQQVAFAAAAGCPEHYLAYLGQRGALYVRAVARPPRSFHAIRHGQALAIGGREWRVITGAGHAPDMACLYCAEARLLISADQILPRISPYVGLHAGEPEADPLGDFLASFAYFRALPEDTLVLPSHGEPFHGLHARLDALEAHHAERLAALQEACRTPRTPHETLPFLFRRALDDGQLGFALGEALAHLRRLERMGAVQAERDATGVVRYRAM